MRPLLPLTRRERDHTNGSPSGGASDVPSDVASCYFRAIAKQLRFPQAMPVPPVFLLYYQVVFDRWAKQNVKRATAA
jgi:hypothetical protein